MVRDPSLSVAATSPAIDVFYWIERLLLLAGIILFIALVREIGASTVWDDVRTVGYGLIPIIGQEALVYLTNTLGWRYAFPPGHDTPPYGRLLIVRFLGDVINSVTPTATVGGEVIRARLLRGEIDASVVWASIAVAAITQAVGQAVFVFGGLLVVLPSTPLPDALRTGTLITMVLFLAGLTAAIVIQRRGMVTTIAHVLGWVRIRLPARAIALMHELDAQISRVYSQPRRFLASAAAFALGWALGTLEVYLILLFLEVPETSWHLALTIEVLSVAIDGALFFVPGKIGTQEGGKVLIFTLLGLPPAKGLALGIIRRLRDLTWSALGLLILSRHQLRERGSIRV